MTAKVAIAVTIASLVMSVAGCHTSHTTPKPQEDPKRMRDTLNVLRDVVLHSDRFEFTMTYYDNGLRRVGPCVTGDGQLRALLTSTAEMEAEPNQLPNVTPMCEQCIELHIVSTKERDSFRVRIVCEKWMAIGNDENYRIKLADTTLVDRLKELANGEAHLDWE
jgi:hypothetical protein